MNPDVTILYDSIRWEEKALLEAGKKKDINIQMVDCKKLALDLEKKPEDYGVVIQRCVSYYRNLHSTAALEGMGVKVINCLNTGVFAGNKLFTHMLLKKFGVPTPDATVAFSKDAAIEALMLMKNIMRDSNPDILLAGTSDGGMNGTPDEVAFAAQRVEGSRVPFSDRSGIKYILVICFVE